MADIKVYAFSEHHSSYPWDRAPPWAIELREMVQSLIDKETINMASVQEQLDGIRDEVTAQTTQISGVATLIQGLRDQISAIPQLTPAQLSEIDLIFSTAHSNSAALADALNAGTAPAAPAAAPSPLGPQTS